MLTITIVLPEFYDNAKAEFIPSETYVIDLEHSLVSLSKWESKFQKPFLGKETKTTEETLWYIEAMTLTPKIPRGVFLHLSLENLDEINTYISSKMTATTITEKQPQRPNREVITSEIIYHWMIALTIPFECQYWHLNRLLTLIRVCNLKNQPSKKMTKGELAQRNRNMNAQRQARLGHSG